MPEAEGVSWYLHAAAVVQRALSRREAVPCMIEGTGTWPTPHPVVRRRGALRGHDKDSGLAATRRGISRPE